MTDANKMLDIEAVMLVRCACGEIVPLSLSTKTVCNACGQIYGTWSIYLRERTQTKSLPDPPSYWRPGHSPYPADSFSGGD